MAGDGSNNPFSVRMDEEDKAALTRLIQESGKGPKEFMTLLMSSYKLTKAKVDVPEMAEDIKHLEAITTQICDIYIGIGKRINTIGETNAMQYNKDLLIYKEKIASLEDNILKVNTEKTDLFNKISKLNMDNEEAEKQLESFKNTIEDKTKIIDDKIKLIEEYKSKNDNLLSMLTDLKVYKEKVDTLSDLLADSQGRKLNLENLLEKLKNEHENTMSKCTDKIKSLEDMLINKDSDHKKELAKKDSDYTKELKSLENISINKDSEYKKELTKKDSDYIKDIENFKKSAEYEKDKSLLNQEKHFNKIINDLTNENNNRIAAIQEHNNKQIFEITNENNDRIAALQENSNKQIVAYQNKIETLLKSSTEKKNTIKNVDSSKTNK